MNRQTTTTTMMMTDGHYGNWQSGMFVRYDWSQLAARTNINDRWDGTFVAACPHGKVVEWRSFWERNPQCLCECR